MCLYICLYICNAHISVPDVLRIYTRSIRVDSRQAPRALQPIENKKNRKGCTLHVHRAGARARPG